MLPQRKAGCPCPYPPPLPFLVSFLHPSFPRGIKTTTLLHGLRLTGFSSQSFIQGGRRGKGQCSGHNHPQHKSRYPPPLTCPPIGYLLRLGLLVLQSMNTILYTPAVSMAPHHAITFGFPGTPPPRAPPFPRRMSSF